MELNTTGIEESTTNQQGYFNRNIVGILFLSTVISPFILFWPMVVMMNWFFKVIDPFSKDDGLGGLFFGGYFSVVVIPVILFTVYSFRGHSSIKFKIIRSIVYLIAIWPVVAILWEQLVGFLTKSQLYYFFSSF